MAKGTTSDYYEQLIEGNRKPLPGDLVFSRNATVGEVAQVTQQHPPFAMGQDVCLLRKRDDQASTDYMQALLRSHLGSVQLDLCMVGSTFKRVNVDEIRNLLVVMPPRKEQHAIAKYLTQWSRRFDDLINEAQQAMGLLRERRSALISAAVTGKIDVRGLAAAAQEAA